MEYPEQAFKEQFARGMSPYDNQLLELVDLQQAQQNELDLYKITTRARSNLPDETQYVLSHETLVRPVACVIPLLGSRYNDAVACRAGIQFRIFNQHHTEKPQTIFSVVGIIRSSKEVVALRNFSYGDMEIMQSLISQLRERKQTTLPDLAPNLTYILGSPNNQRSPSSTL